MTTTATTNSKEEDQFSDFIFSFEPDGFAYLKNDPEIIRLNPSDCKTIYDKHDKAMSKQYYRAMNEERKRLCKLLDDLMCFIPENRRDLNIFRKCKAEVIRAHVELDNPITMLWAEEWKDDIDLANNKGESI